MKYLRFLDAGVPRYGLVEGNEVTILSGDPFHSPAPTTSTRKLDTLQLLPPCVPSKIIGIGLNYKDHAAEIGAPLPAEPRIFLKPPTCLLGHGGDIVWPSGVERVDYEAELVAVIGKTAKGVSEEDALNHVFGYSCGNDVSARDIQARDKLPNRAKAFDTFGPVGPVIATGLNPDNLKLECLVNGRVRQSGTTADLIFGVAYLVSFLSSVMTLLPGDLIFTGTPKGIGPLEPGDTVEVRIEGIGTLRNRLVAGS